MGRTQTSRGRSQSSTSQHPLWTKLLMNASSMIEIAILKVENPSCLWGRIVKGRGIPNESPKEYGELQVNMNLYYHAVNQDVKQIKPTSLAEGQVCVVYFSACKKWCRAVVESLPVGNQAMCFLVDHGERIIVRSDEVRAPLEKFLQLPFWVRKYHLSGLHPLRLQVSICEEKAVLVPSTQWDSSATRYLHNLLQASTQMEAVLLDTLSGSTAIELYLTIRNVKICANDDLVTKRFACSTSEETLGGALSGLADQPPAVLGCDIFQDTDNFLATSGTPQLYLTFGEKEEGDEPVTQTVPEQGEPGRAAPQTQGELGRASPQTQGEPGRAAPQTQGEPGRAAPQTQGEIPAWCNGGSPAVQPPGSGPDAVEVKGVKLSAGGDVAGGPVTQTPTQKETIEEELACARLLQFLNPDPLKLDLDSPEATQGRSDQEGRIGVLVHSAFPMEPCSSLASAPILDSYRRILQRQKCFGLSLAEGYSWPAVARGCDTVLISHSGGDPLTYLPPLLTHMQLISVFSSLSARSGPLAVILCPGWGKAQTVYDRLEESHSLQSLHPTVVLVGQARDEAKAVHIPKNCLVVVTTPFSLARLLPVHCFLFLRLCHLVLDEADQLFSRAPDQMSSILQYFQKVTASEDRVSCPRQIVAVGRRWSPSMEDLLLSYMKHPCVVITVMEEAALYGNVHQIVLLFLDCTKVSGLLGALDLTPGVRQKTLIITSSPEEVEHVFQAVNKTSAFSLKAHEGMTYQFDFVMEQWRKEIGPGTHVILVSTDACLQALGIQDASCVVHYSFPSSPRRFGDRLACMVDNFCNRSDKECPRPSSPPKSVLLLTERNSRHVTGVLRYLRRTGAALPPELLHFARGVGQAKELQRAGRPLCSYLKSYGFCRDSSVCPDRHSLCPSQDQPCHPSSGSIVVLPLYIKTASQYCGRIVSGIDDCYESLAANMAAHYATEKLMAVEVLEGGLYCVQEKETYHRVQVTVVPERGERLFLSVQARFLDEGREQEVKAHQLLQLPPQFHSLPPQALEIILCRVKPIDGEVDWNPKVTRAISQKIRGLQHQAKVVLSLGNTIFVDPMVRMTRLPALKTFIHQHNVHTEILNTGMGTTNPQHLDLLRELTQRAEPAAEEGEEQEEEGSQMKGLEGSLEGSQVTMDDEGQAAEKAVTCRRRAAVESLCCGQEGSEDPPSSQKQGPTEPPPQSYREGPTEPPPQSYREGPTEPLPQSYREGPTEPLPQSYREGPTEPPPQSYREGPTEPPPQSYREGPTEPLPQSYREGPTEPPPQSYREGPTEPPPQSYREGPTEPPPQSYREGPTEPPPQSYREGPTEPLPQSYREGPTEPLPQSYREGPTEPPPQSYREGPTEPPLQSYREGPTEPPPQSYREGPTEPLPQSYREGPTEPLPQSYREGPTEPPPQSYREGPTEPLPQSYREGPTEPPPQSYREGPTEPPPQSHGGETAAAVTTQDRRPDAEQWSSLIANLKHAARTLGNSDMKEFKQLISTVHSAVGNGQSTATKHAVKAEKVANVTGFQGAIKVDAPKSLLHPQVKWFQRKDVVVISVKLINPVAQSCDFFPERVVYSAKVNNSRYRADLELLLPVAADRCSWEMKCNEPVITLVKRERGEWEALLKRKSNFVSLDFDHFEDESETPNGLVGSGDWFVEGTGEDGNYVSSASGSESD
ncbi:putative ATP-dependent RNA helicase TDRD12 [Hypomesus transpacificus]|uniref:putative ATP-dependent RNA helicase TDRD12 n=1 Tax=Hypomesus transpacificus TaxID=137520 RepID=UPI001F07AD6E|nr:putative ATP-dependent RNA helicase TDRD12 [Hypomesus transpacificus]